MNGKCRKRSLTLQGVQRITNGFKLLQIHTTNMQNPFQSITKKMLLFDLIGICWYGRPYVHCTIWVCHGAGFSFFLIHDGRWLCSLIFIIIPTWFWDFNQIFFFVFANSVNYLNFMSKLYSWLKLYFGFSDELAKLVVIKLDNPKFIVVACRMKHIIVCHFTMDKRKKKKTNTRHWPHTDIKSLWCHYYHLLHNLIYLIPLFSGRYYTETMIALS